MSHENHAPEMIASLPCNVELPQEWTDFFQRSGPVAAHWQDHRRFPRFYFRLPAALDCLPSLPALSRPATRWKVYVKDVSRGGVAFLHFEQLFPREQLALVLLDGTLHQLEVARCRRVQDRCFEIGACFA